MIQKHSLAQQKYIKKTFNYLSLNLKLIFVLFCILKTPIKLSEIFSMFHTKMLLQLEKFSFHEQLHWQYL